MTAPQTRQAAALAAALALVAGFCDGIAYVRWGAFAANQTGNTVLLGIAAYHGDATMIERSLGAIASLAVGATIASLLRTRTSCVVPLSAEAATLAAASFVHGHAVQLDVIAFAMGLQNQAITTFAGVKLNTSFVTGHYTQIGVAIGDMLLGKDRDGAQRRLVILAALVVFYCGGGAAAAWSAARLEHALLLVVPIVLAIAYVARRTPGTVR
ncbi:MAG TPA: YoaK family protein [Candidatus Sulfotelmatobacter sp.]|nr:YoaK family protein [Candidatus Sulfotelmatobacter sp.]